MRRRSALGVIGGIASLACGVQFPHVSQSTAKAEIKDLTQQLQTAIDRAHADTAYTPRIWKPATLQEINSLPGDERYGKGFSYYIDGPGLAGFVNPDNPAIAVQYIEMFRTYMRRSTDVGLWLISPAEATRYELDECLNGHDRDLYRSHCIYPYQCYKDRQDEEVVCIVRAEHSPLMHVHKPIVNWCESRKFDGTALDHGMWCVSLVIHMEIGSRVRKHMRKHSGVHKTYTANVQWKDPGNVPADDPLRRTTIGPCACCK